MQITLAVNYPDSQIVQILKVQHYVESTFEFSHPRENKTTLEAISTIETTRAEEAVD